MDGFITALRAELFVATRSTGNRLIVLLPALIVAAQLFTVKLTVSGQAARDALLGESTFDAAEAVNAYGHFVDGLSTGLILLALILVAWSAYSFSNDRDTGVVRHLIIRRVSRRALLMAKLCVFHISGLLSLVALIALTALISSTLWQFGPVVEDGYELIGTREIHQEILLGLKLALIPLPAAIAFGVLISTFCQNATQAVTIALGVTISLDIFKGLLGDLSHYLYVSFQPSLVDQSYLSDVGRIVRGYSDVMLDDKVLQLNLWVPIPEMLVFVVFALVLIQKRKL